MFFTDEQLITQFELYYVMCICRSLQNNLKEKEKVGPGRSNVAPEISLKWCLSTIFC